MDLEGLALVVHLIAVVALAVPTSTEAVTGSTASIRTTSTRGEAADHPVLPAPDFLLAAFEVVASILIHRCVEATNSSGIATFNPEFQFLVNYRETKN